MKIDLKKVKILNVKEGDTIVIESDYDQQPIAELLKCNVIVVDDINKIGVLKFNDNKKSSKKE